MNRSNVENYLIDDGIPTSIRGFGYLTDAIMIYRRNIGITTELYPRVAGQNNTTPSRVERAMRHAVSKSSGGGNTNSEYISYAHLMLSRKDSA